MTYKNHLSRRGGGVGRDNGVGRDTDGHQKSSKGRGRVFSRSGVANRGGPAILRRQVVDAATSPGRRVLRQASR
jgi:hypothetical protein